MKKPLVVAAVFAVSTFLLADCSTGNAPANNSSSTPSASALKLQDITDTILPDNKLGSDGKIQYAYADTKLQVVQGVPVNFTIYNYDDKPHAFTSQGLGVNFTIPGSTQKGVPSVRTFHFTPKTTGAYKWNKGDMGGSIDVVPSSTNVQYIDLAVQGDLKVGPIKKTKTGKTNLHDAFSPTDFTVQKGIPVKVTVTNFDSGLHSITSPSLNLNQVITYANEDGNPFVTTFTFTPTKTGNFSWRCVVACDGGLTSYSMTHQGYMQGIIHVVD